MNEKVEVKEGEEVKEVKNSDMAKDWLDRDRYTPCPRVRVSAGIIGVMRELQVGEGKELGRDLFWLCSVRFEEKRGKTKRRDAEGAQSRRKKAGSYQP